MNSMPLSGKVVQILLLASWKEYCSMQGHSSTGSSVPYASVKEVGVVGACNEGL